MALHHGRARRSGAPAARCALLALAFAPIAAGAAGPDATDLAPSPLAAAADRVVPGDVLAVPDYRGIGARHLYDTFAARVFKGRLPPLLYAIAIVDTEIDADGHVLDAVVTREPAVAKEVMPWILGLIRQASPFPRPAGGARTTYHDIWLVDRGYTFQLDTLTEGQE